MRQLNAADVAQLDEKFGYHQPSAKGVAAAHEHWRDACRDLAEDALRLLPSSRELSLVLTQIEQAMFWGNAAIARRQVSLAADPDQPTSTLVPDPADTEATAIERLVDHETVHQGRPIKDRPQA